MAELLLRVVDKGAGPMLSKAGDVIALREDGWQWSALERANPHWRIVSMPGVPTEQLVLLMEAALDATGNVIARRARRFNTEHAEFKRLLAVPAGASYRPESVDALLATVVARQHPSKVTLS